MKIAIVNDHFSSGPGGQHRLQNIAEGFSRLGHQVLYITPNNISHSVFESPLPLSGPKKFIYPYFTEFFSIYRQLQVMPSGINFLLIGLPNTMSKSLNALFGIVKKIPTAFDFGGLWTSFFDKGATYDSRSAKLKLFRPISQFYEDALTIFSSRLPDLITVPTSGLDYFFEHYTRRATQVIYHPVDTTVALNPSLKKPIAIESFPRKYQQCRFVAVGVKGDEWFVPILERIIKSFKNTNLVFLVIGAFPKAQHMCKKKGLTDKVFFTGNVPYYILPSYIALAEFAVVLTPPDLTSIWYAPHNIAKITDFMAMGKPVVTDSLSAADYVESGVTGFLVKDTPDLIRRAGNLADNPELLLRISKATRKSAIEKFDSVKVAARYLKLFEKLG